MFTEKINRNFLGEEGLNRTERRRIKKAYRRLYFVEKELSQINNDLELTNVLMRVSGENVDSYLLHKSYHLQVRRANLVRMLTEYKGVIKVASGED